MIDADNLNDGMTDEELENFYENMVKKDFSKHITHAERVTEFVAWAREQLIKRAGMNDGFFPRATIADRNGGWDIDTPLLKKIADTTEEMHQDFKVDMESVELVLLSLEQLGWKVEAPNVD